MSKAQPESSFRFPTRYRLKSRKLIQSVFTAGTSQKQFPVRFNYLLIDGAPEESPIQVSFSVSKRTFKRAVDRNRVKRVLRELFRLHQHPLISAIPEGKQLVGMFLYIGRDLPDYQLLEPQFLLLLKKMSISLADENT